MKESVAGVILSTIFTVVNPGEKDRLLMDVWAVEIKEENATSLEKVTASPTDMRPVAL